MASVGPQSPTAAIGSVNGHVAWTGPTNVFSSNDSRATVSLGGPFTATRGLRITGFDFSAIPGGSTINGIVVEVERSCSSTSGNPHDSYLGLVKAATADGDIYGTNKASGTTWPTSDAYATYGSSSDLWGGTWSLADIQNAGFGIDIHVVISGFKVASTVRIDHVRITVYYTGGSSVPISAIAHHYKQLQSQ